MRKKNKFITALLAAFMIMAAFFTPMTAYANEDGGEHDTVYGEDGYITVWDFDDLGGLSLIELLEQFTVGEMIEMFGAFDISGFDFDDPPNESAVPDISKPFTPDGQATVVDLAYEGDGKMFYTFRTPAGNVFYLIIDRQRGTDNVYFLNAVTEYDLLALAESGKIAPNVPESAIPTKPPTTTANNNNGADENPGDPEKDVTPPPPKKSNNGLLIFLLIGAAVVGGVCYYIKIVRPKQQAGMDDDEDDDIPDGNDDSEEMEFEDEPEEADEYEDNDETDADENDEE